MAVSDFYFTEAAARADGAFMVERVGGPVHVYKVAIPDDGTRVAEDGSHYRAPIWFCLVKPEMVRLFQWRWGFATVDHIVTLAGGNEDGQRSKGAS